ncbi:hypothetical protein BDR26DRAFT_1006214, partial [Obelidium mucronatum]
MIKTATGIILVLLHGLSFAFFLNAASDPSFISIFTSLLALIYLVLSISSAGFVYRLNQTDQRHFLIMDLAVSLLLRFSLTVWLFQSTSIATTSNAPPPGFMEIMHVLLTYAQHLLAIEYLSVLRASRNEEREQNRLDYLLYKVWVNVGSPLGISCFLMAWLKLWRALPLVESVAVNLRRDYFILGLMLVIAGVLFVVVVWRLV